MECLKITGMVEDDPEEKYELDVPAFLEYEESTFRKDFDVEVVKNVRASFKDISKIRCFPFVKDLYVGMEAEFVNCQLSSCPLPINQGPIVCGLDNDKGDIFGNKLFQKIAWRHSDGQSCGIWTAEEKNDKDNVFAKFKVEPYEEEQKVIGPHSNLSDMSVVYTCNKMQCKLKCPCKLCLSKLDDCSRKCLDFPCMKCACSAKITELS